MSEAIKDEKAIIDPLAEFHKQGRRWAILVVYCLLNMVLIYATMGLAGLGARIIMDYGITPGDFSFMSTIPFLAGFILCFFMGGLSDKFGVKSVLAVCICVAAIGCLLRALLIDTFSLLILANFFIGVGSGGLNSTSQKILNIWFDPRMYNLAIGIYVCTGTLGASVGLMSAMFFPETVTFMWVTCIMMFICFALVLLVIKNKPAGYPQQPSEPYLRYLGEALKHKSVWIAAILFFLLYGACTADNQFWVAACVAARGVSEAEAGIVGSVTTIGLILGSLIVPAIIAKSGRSRIWTIILGFCSPVLLAIAWNIPYGTLTIVIFFFHLFCNGALLGQVKALPAQLSDLQPIYVGAASGFQSALQNLGAFVIPTYVVALIAGADYMLMYNIIAAVFLVFGFVTLLIPKSAGIK